MAYISFLFFEAIFPDAVMRMGKRRYLRYILDNLSTTHARKNYQDLLALLRKVRTTKSFRWNFLLTIAPLFLLILVKEQPHVAFLSVLLFLSSLFGMIKRILRKYNLPPTSQVYCQRWLKSLAYLLVLVSILHLFLWAGRNGWHSLLDARWLWEEPDLSTIYGDYDRQQEMNFSMFTYSWLLQLISLVIFYFSPTGLVWPKQQWRIGQFLTKIYLRWKNRGRT